MPGASVIICEFNPLHRGHMTVLERAASFDGPVICVMSGNFTQRSECAIFDKYKRAAAAIECGADLVFELPFPWCSAGGEFFALGGVSIGAGVKADRFVFGSEIGDIDQLRCAADLTKRREFIDYVSRESDPTHGAARSHRDALEHFGFTLGANDTLGIEYIKAVERLRARVGFTAVKRMTDENIYRSATELRRMIFSSGSDAARQFIPPNAYAAYGPCPDIDAERLCELEYLYFRFFRDLYPHITPTFEGQGGVSERLINAAAESPTYKEFFTNAATKKYTNSRLRRAALFEMLGVEKDMLSARPRYTVLLGATMRGREYLAENKKKLGITILTKPSADYELSEVGMKQYALAKRADELYLACTRGGATFGEFIRKRPYIK